jgi:hypothetical protein
MASTTSRPEHAEEDGPSIDMIEFGRRLAARRAELGYPVVPRNSGANRTESKRALLVEIDKAAAAKGFKW